MGKKILWGIGAIAVLFAIIAVTFSGCLGSSTNSQTTPSAYQKTVVDMSGRTVILPENITRVAFLAGPCTPDMYIINASDKLCAITESVKKRKFLLKIDPSLNDMATPRMGGNDMNIEEVVANNPDIVIGYITDVEVIDQHSNLITISLASSASSFAAQREEILLLGQIFGKEIEAEKYVAYLNGTLVKIDSHLSNITENERKTVYLGFGTDYLTTFGNNTLMQERLEAAGCRNAAESVETPLEISGGGGSQVVNIEEVLKWNPDIIVIEEGTPEDIYSNPQWQNVKAIKEKQVYLIPEGTFRWNRRSAEGAVLFTEWMAITAYPENFTDVEFSDDLKDFYREIFNYELTDSDVKSIMRA